MRILVLSDSHGNVDNMARAVELTAPDRVLHLGDCQRDLTALRARFPALPMEGVPGNCDWGSCDQPERLLEIGGVRIFALHGAHAEREAFAYGRHVRGEGVRCTGAAVRTYPCAAGGQRRLTADAEPRRGRGSTAPYLRRADHRKRQG